MPLMTCPECGRAVSTHAAACPHCGAPLGVSDTANGERNTANGPLGVTNGALGSATGSNGLVTSEANGGKVMNLTNILLLVLIALILVVCILGVILRKNAGAASSNALPKGDADAPAMQATPAPATAAESPATTTVTTPATSSGTLTAADQAAISAVISAWDAGHASDALDVLLKTYAPSVNFYGRSSTPEYCVDNVIKLLDKGYYEQHSQNITLTPQAGGDVRADFAKLTISYKGERTYPSYLFLRKIGGEWKITVESDGVTDRNLMKHRR